MQTNDYLPERTPSTLFVAIRQPAVLSLLVDTIPAAQDSSTSMIASDPMIALKKLLLIAITVFCSPSTEAVTAYLSSASRTTA
jgi:hypothetical protein